MYMVLQLNKKVNALIGGESIELSLSYADGMIGALPVNITIADANDALEYWLNHAIFKGSV